MPFRWIFALLAVVPLLAACGGDDDDSLPMEPGACIAVADDDAVSIVDCEDATAELVLVQDLGVAADTFGTTCPSGTRSQEISLEQDGRELGPSSTWCVVDAGDVTPAVQDIIDEQQSDGS